MERILKVQQQIGVLGKDSENPFFKSAYLDLNKLLINVTPLLHAEGLVLMQPVKGSAVHSIIYDSKDGVVIESSHMDIPSQITDPQKLGSAITYFRRYTLKSLLAIAEGDDDGNLSAIPEPVKPTEPVKVKLTDEQVERMCKTQKDEFLKESLNTYNLTEFQITAIKAKLGIK